MFGNQTVARLMRAGVLQPKLRVSAPDDSAEREADRIAEGVTRAPAAMIQRKCAQCAAGKPCPKCAEEEDGVVQRRVGAGSAPEAVSDGFLSKLGPGSPLGTSERAEFEQGLGVGLRGVRIHTGQEADRLASGVNARAFTVREHMVFGEGQYAPQSPDGRRLLAHELAHTIQQRGAEARLQRAISPELDKIEDYLSYGLFDWAITDSDAINALQLLKGLPRFQQAVFFPNDEQLQRLQDNLPTDRLKELHALQDDVAPMRPPTKVVEDIRSELSYGLFDWVVTDKEAVDALEKLKQLSGMQLAVALGSINYGRLMDNLPDSRKQELIDLLARGLGTEGTRGTEEKEHPGTILNSITVKSNQRVLKDDTDDWENGGARYPQPEWSVVNGKVASYPISQKKGSNVQIDAKLNVLPVGATAAPIRLTGKSDAGFLTFEFAGSMHGGMNQTVSMTSSAPLPDEIAAIPSQGIIWTMEWQDWKHEIGRTQINTIFVTYENPAALVTYRRMAKAVELTRGFGNDPHAIVLGQMGRMPTYSLCGPACQFIPNPWPIGDDVPDHHPQAECQAIVRFVGAVNEAVGIPGEAEGITVYASPSDPDTPLVGVLTERGGPGMGQFAPQPGTGYKAGLFDGGDNFNNYEAALKFTNGATAIFPDVRTTKYYPGGAGGSAVTSVLAVLHVFKKMAWSEVGTPRVLIFCYHPPCPT